jgi:hypothetical protein
MDQDLYHLTWYLFLLHSYINPTMRNCTGTQRWGWEADSYRHHWNRSYGFCQIWHRGTKCEKAIKTCFCFIVHVTVSQVSQVANEPSYLAKPSQLLSVSVARQSSLINDLTKIISYLAFYFTRLIKLARSVDPGLLDQF